MVGLATYPLTWGERQPGLGSRPGSDVDADTGIRIVIWKLKRVMETVLARTGKTHSHADVRMHRDPWALFWARPER